MIRYTTPTVGVRLDNIELEAGIIEEMILTIQPIDKTTKVKRGESIVIDSPQVETVEGPKGVATVISAKLTQEQSGSLSVGMVEIQVNLLLTDGTRFASNPVYQPVTKNLHEQVMPSVETVPTEEQL